MPVFCLLNRLFASQIGLAHIVSGAETDTSGKLLKLKLDHDLLSMQMSES